jgi:alpha-beta hydrolase superfamily lysophospholipase
MNVVARTLSESGVAAVAIDARGHGASGPLGAKVTLLPDVDHIGVVYRPAALGAIV